MVVNNLLEQKLSKISKQRNVIDVIKNGDKFYAITDGKIKAPRNSDINILTISDIFNPNSSQADIIEGGFSIQSNKPLAEVLGLNSQILFTYNLQNLSSLEKSKFSHAVLGRGKSSSGLVGELGGKILGKGCIAVPERNSNQIRELMKKWKVGYTTEKILKRGG